MATRLYLTNSTTPFTPTNNRGAWDQVTSAIIKYLGPAPGGVAATRGQAETSATNNFDVLLGRWVSDGAVATGTMSGVASWAIGFLESNAAANDFSHIHIYVTAGNTDTVRGTLLTDSIGATELPVAAAGATELDKTLSSVSVQAGDRLVVEIGYQAQNTVTTSRTGTMNYGNTGAVDLTAGQTSVTTAPGWVQFSDPNGLFEAVSANEKNMCPNPSAGSGIGSNWSANSNYSGTATTVTGFSRSTGIHYVASATAYSTAVTPKIPAAAGEVWAGYVELSCSASRAGQVYFNFQDATGAFLSPNPVNNVTFGAWQRSSFTGVTAPANTATVGISIESANIVAGDTLDVSCVRFDLASSVAAYADGDSSNWVWDGTAEVSTSHSLGAQSVSPSGVASAEAFGTAQLNLNITATGVASGETFGAAQLNLNVTATGIASAEAFGTTIVTLPGVFPSGIPSAETFGTAQFNLNVSPSGIATGEAFGTASIQLNIKPTGIASAEAFGSVTLTTGPVSISPAGIVSAEAFGSASLNLRILPTGIGSGEAFGVPNVALNIAVTGIASAEAFGAVTVAGQAAVISPSGIVSAEAFGSVTITKQPAWRLLAPILDERMVDRGIRIPRRTGLTVYGDDTLLVASETPGNGLLAGKKYVFYGGYEYITLDVALHDLWVASGFEVELV